MHDIVFSSEIKSPIKSESVKKIVEVAASQVKKIQGVVEITIVGDKKIKSLNKNYRGKDRITDVLSFSWLEGGKMPGNFLGQIYICYPQIVRQAKEFSISNKEEFSRMLVHGLLHIVGYDHITKAGAKKMFDLQEKIVKKSD